MPYTELGYTTYIQELCKCRWQWIDDYVICCTPVMSDLPYKVSKYSKVSMRERMNIYVYTPITCTRCLPAKPTTL
jgi:hypothetical protein